MNFTLYLVMRDGGTHIVQLLKVAVFFFFFFLFVFASHMSA